MKLRWRQKAALEAGFRGLCSNYSRKYIAKTFSIRKEGWLAINDLRRKMHPLSLQVANGINFQTSQKEISSQMSFYDGDNLQILNFVPSNSTHLVLNSFFYFGFFLFNQLHVLLLLYIIILNILYLNIQIWEFNVYVMNFAFPSHSSHPFSSSTEVLLASKPRPTFMASFCVWPTGDNYSALSENKSCLLENEQLALSLTS